MLEFVLRPLDGIGPINFGMTRGEVRGILAELGQHEAKLKNPNTECFLQNAFQVSYDEDGRVEFIETAASTEFRVLFHDSCLHELKAEDAVALVSQFAKYEKTVRDPGYSYVFPALQLSLWRRVMPRRGSDTRGRRFEAVGAGKEGYFSPRDGSVVQEEAETEQR